jgi:hypothetical protein
MAQPRGGLGLQPDPVPEAVVGGHGRVEYLHRDLAAEDLVVAAPDDGHAARPELLHQTVPVAEDPAPE